MLTSAYILIVTLAGILAAVNCLVPALILAGVAAVIVFRHEIRRWTRNLSSGPAPRPN